MSVTKLEQKLLGIFTVVIVAVTVTMCFLVTYFPNLHNVASGLKDTWFMSSAQSRTSVLVMLREKPAVENAQTTDVDYLQGHQIRFELPYETKDSDIAVSTNPLEQRVVISIAGIKSTYLYDYPIIGITDNIIDITYDSYEKEGYFNILLDDVLEPKLSRNGKFLYLDFVDPHDVYDYVVVVDSGHGADSVGAIKNDIYEKDINLQIVLCLKELLDKNPYNIGVYYTKTEDENPSYASRVNLANFAAADAYVSIHNNTTSTGRTSDVNGTEVMYRGSDISGESRKLSEILLKNVTRVAGSTDKGTVVGDDIYIIRTSEVPVALVEVGFMTNPAEFERLCDHDYQMKVAEGVYSGILEYLNIEEGAE